ncbi:Protein-tyrosine-phosphatase IBR5 [Apostasia shenzhenica]|uniref:Protein-tyrosine-phosphatase IBR5 n=1 Tax=Apostasia shenzhenica TaxID=1088818 RepID=A0A2I0AB95_9ASPA|nr:Protein-tyrosine-phosphatase IBR5 [Apostasia shenzhenica]
MRKRERENPCGVCGHYHRYEEGEVCGVCGHRFPLSTEKAFQLESAFPTEILKDFLYLGSYDNASRGELLKTLGISRILNTVPTCQNLYKNSFTYHCLPAGDKLQFDDAIQFLEQCDKDKARVLVHCMSGKNRSPAFVIAYLMRSRGWRLSHSFQWVKDRRPPVELTPVVQRQLVEFENRIFGSHDIIASMMPASDSVPSFGFKLQLSSESEQTPAFDQPSSTSIFQRLSASSLPNAFVFGAERTSEHLILESSAFKSGSEGPMDSS